MIFLRSCGAAIWLNLASLKGRVWPALIVVAGVACVVGVLLSMLSMTIGLRQSWQRAGSPDRAIVLHTGTQAEGDGTISRADSRMHRNVPVRQTPMTSFQSASAISRNRRSRGKPWLVSRISSRP